MQHTNFVKNLIQKGEGEQLDFKQTINSAQKISKILCAFSNTKGGILLVGIKDNGHPCKINILEEQHVLEHAADFYCKPSIVLDFSAETFKGFSILKVTIPSSTHKPTFSKGDDNKWWAYIRVHDQCLLASKVMLDVLRTSNRSEGKAVEFGNAEKILLSYLDKNSRVTLKEFTKMANIGRWRAQKILVNLVGMNIIKVISTEKTDFYSI